MRDTELEYWKEALLSSADENEVTITDEQAVAMAKSMILAQEFYGQASGHECIPNPLQTELSNEKRAHAQRIKDMEAREDALKKDIASRYGSPVWVSIRDGRVQVEAQR